MKITEAGLYRDIAVTDYFADPCPEPSLTQSIAKILIAQTPLHAKMSHPRLTPPGDDDEAEKYVKAQAIGNAAHLTMIGRGKTLEIIAADNFTTKAAREKRDEASAAGKTPILEKHYLVAHQMTVAARLQLDQIDGCETAFKEGDGEIVAACNDNGLWLRTMIDWLSSDKREIWDYKTTGQSASPYVVGKKMVDDGWDVQAAMIEHTLDAIDPENAGRRKFRFVCQENDPPFALTVSELTEGPMTMGRKKLQYAINAWRECMTSGIWPAYPPRILRPEYPSWQETSWLNREIAEAEDAIPRVAAPKMLTDIAGG